MFQKRITVDAQLVSIITCILFLSFYNYTFWQQLANFAGPPFMLGTGIFIFTFLFGILTLASFKYTFKPILIVAFLIAAVSAYSMDNFGYVISTEAFRNVVETDTNEAFDLLNWRLISTIFLLFVLPTIALLAVKIKYPSYKKRFFYLSICVILCIANLILFGSNYITLLRNHKIVRYYINPVRPIYSMLKYTVLRFKPGIVREFIELDNSPTRVVSAGKPTLVVLVVGESDRAMNHQLNGYTKKTNPLLSTRRDIYSFNKFYSCGTETTVSVPCMFSVFKREEYTDHKGRYTENVLDLLQKSKVQVLWRDNDSGCKNVCNRITTEDLNEAKIAPYCNSSECHDEVLLHNLQKYINTNIGDKLIVLHKKGNHGPAYYKRYPAKFEQFTPTCETNEIHKCSNQEIVNTYDNIVVYTDYFLDTVIKQLEQNSDKYQTAMIYVSDHGESLGERGIYLHAMPYWLAPIEQTHVPFIFWASKDFAIDRQRLAQIQQQEFSHDHLFHSLLGLFKVQTVVYAPELDMFADGV